jgi:hypothetical protein
MKSAFKYISLMALTITINSCLASQKTSSLPAGWQEASHFQALTGSNTKLPANWKQTSGFQALAGTEEQTLEKVPAPAQTAKTKALKKKPKSHVKTRKSPLDLQGSLHDKRLKRPVPLMPGPLVGGSSVAMATSTHGGMSQPAPTSVYDNY